MKKTSIEIPLAALELNEGQLEWLPKNPRQWTREDMDKTVASLKSDPDFLDERPILVTPAGSGGKYVVFCGNLRTSSAGAAKLKTLPCVVYIPEGTGDALESDRETIRRRAILDNGQFGSWDVDELSSWGYEAAELEGFGVPGYVTGYAGEGEAGGDGTGKDSDSGECDSEKLDFVEELLNEAMRDNVKEALMQIDSARREGWFVTFFTEGMCRDAFLRAKYYGERYSQYLSLYFCPERFYTSANKASCYEQMKRIAAGENAGIAGLRTMTLGSSAYLFFALRKAGYPFGDARMPQDFPANKARDLIIEFGGRGCSVLDPCHGWGGRLTGALMADVSLYYGVDPSEEAHRGVERTAKAFLPYCPDSRVELIQCPFEDADIPEGTFDIAITSPPYFDVEQYHGEGQSHERYPQYDKWVEGFLTPLLTKTHAAIKDGGVFVLNVGSQTYELKKDCERIATQVGFQIIDVRPFGGLTASSLHTQTDDSETNEKIIILKKT